MLGKPLGIWSWRSGQRFGLQIRGSYHLCEPFFKINFYLLSWAVLGPCCSVRASHRGGFSCCRAQALGHTGFSRYSAWAPYSCPEHGLRHCGTRAYLPCGMWDLPGPGIKPMSPALAGGFFLPLSHQRGPSRHPPTWAFCKIPTQIPKLKQVLCAPVWYVEKSYN